MSNLSDLVVANICNARAEFYDKFNAVSRFMEINYTVNVYREGQIFHTLM